MLEQLAGLTTPVAIMPPGREMVNCNVVSQPAVSVTVTM
jgi:hypothetical protein